MQVGGRPRDAHWIPDQQTSGMTDRGRLRERRAVGRLLNDGKDGQVME